MFTIALGENLTYEKVYIRIKLLWGKVQFGDKQWKWEAPLGEKYYWEASNGKKLAWEAISYGIHYTLEASLLGKNIGAALGKVPYTERNHPTDWIKTNKSPSSVWCVLFRSKLYIYIYYKSYDHYI